MDLSICFVLLLPLATCLAAPTAQTQEETLRSLINPPQAAMNANDNMINSMALPATHSFKTVGELKEALTSQVKSQLMTSLAALSPEMASTAGTSTATTELSQLNLMGGINSLVSIIVEKLLQALLPNIMNRRPGAAGGAMPPTPNTFPMGGILPGLFGSGGMNPFMMFSMLNNMFDFI